MKRWIAVALFAAMTLAFAVPATAAECEGVTFPNQITVDGTELGLNGLGMREATMFKVDVYVAGLYVENKSSDGAKLAGADEKKRLKLHFVRDVDKSDVTGAFEDNFKGDSAKLSKLNGWMSAMKEGQTMTFTYLPDEGMTVQVNGSTKGTIEGKDFAQAFFNIWLGSDPPNSGLKSGLLGGSCG